MKRYVVLAALLLTSLWSFGTHSQLRNSSQFHVRSQQSHRAGGAKAERRIPSAEKASAPARAPLGNSAQPRSKVRHASTAASASAPNFVTSTQIPTTGTDDDYTEPVLGDFNGDGKQDVAKVVFNVVSSVTTYQISTLLGNGDGTFQTAVLTNTPSNADDPIVVADLNGDGKDDIIMIHPAVNNGCAATRSQARPQGSVLTCGASMDVLLSNGDGTFATPVNYTITFAFLAGGLLTDVNGDGKLDVLVFDDNTPANVIALLGNGDGTFQAPTTLSQLSTSAPGNMFFADFNGDGNIDIGGQVSGQVEVMLATAAGTFAAPVRLNTPDGAYDACMNTTGDLNGDGKPEIVSVNCDMNTITIYVNAGDGTFATGVYYNSNGDYYSQPSAAAIGDVNGDGKPDIVVDNVYTGDISVFLGRGDGSADVEAVSYSMGGFPWTTPLLADFNGDGLMDVMVADDYYNMVYLQGYGDGSFRGAPVYDLPNSFSQGAFTFSLASADFNGDGIPDVVVGQRGNNGSVGIVVYLGKGDGTFYPGNSYGASNDLEEVVVADFNGDGRPDIAAVDSNAGIVQILVGNGDGTFSVGLSYPTDPGSQPSPRNLVTGDFNHDGKMDLAIANSNTRSVDVLLGNGDGTFASAVSYPLTSPWVPEDITMADINGDGYLDLAVLAFSTNGPPEAIGILLANNDNSGTFQTATYTNVVGYPEAVAFGDLNGDGKADMVVTLWQGVFYGDVSVAMGNGDGTFGTFTDYPGSALDGGLGDPFPGPIRLTDINGDGKLDVLYIHNNFGTVAVALGNGDGTLAAPIEFPVTEYAWGLALADVNNDGAMDVLVGQDESGGFDVLINGNGSGTAGNYAFGTQTPSATVTAGGSATYTLNIAGLNGYNGTVTFTCGTLPTGATCSFSPSSVVANGNVPLTTTLTISTTASANASVSRPTLPGEKPGSPILLAGVGGIGLFGLLIAGSGPKAGRRRVAIMMGVLVLLTLGMLVACDNENPTKTTTTTTSTSTPAGSYAVTVTSTGTGTSAPTHSVSVTLVVQ